MVVPRVRRVNIQALLELMYATIAVRLLCLTRNSSLEKIETLYGIESMESVHVSSFITRPSFTMSSISVECPPILGTIREKKKSCCPFGDCKKRLTAAEAMMSCRCGVSFCPTHRLPEQHMCAFNYRAAATQHLSTQLVKCAGERLVDKL